MAKNEHTKEEQKIIEAALLESRIKASELRAAEKITAILKEENCHFVPVQSFASVEIASGQIRYKEPTAEVRIISLERQDK